MTMAADTLSPLLVDPFGPAVVHLSASDPDWASLIGRVGRCGLQAKPEREPYEALIRAIAHQQLHGRAAEAILNRFLACYPDVTFPSPTSILETDGNIMRACGFSATKVTTIHGIAERALDGIVPARSAALAMTDEELISRLVSLRGIGRWTVEMFLIFTLERPDVLPVDDFGVREGWRVMKSLSKQPLPKELFKIGLAWSPYRSIATWYLWQAADEFKRLKAK
jgi:DNA-3-methyladenine glycosylase II